jgi:hypothetical protein
MRNIKALLLESITIDEAKHERQEIDNLQFKVSCIMSNFPYSEYGGKEDDAVKLVTESIVKFLSEVFSEYKEKIEVNAKRIISQGLSKMFKQYIPVKVKAEELWKSGDGFSDEEFKIGQQEQKMIDYMIKAVKNYIEKIYNFANKEAEKDDNKVSESFDEFCENIFEKLDDDVNKDIILNAINTYIDSYCKHGKKLAPMVFLRYLCLALYQAKSTERIVPNKLRDLVKTELPSLLKKFDEVQEFLDTNLEQSEEDPDEFTLSDNQHKQFKTLEDQLENMKDSFATKILNRLDKEL